MSSDLLIQALSQVYGSPCWRVCQGHGSFLTFEFGAPHDNGFGEWHLWIFCCEWRITGRGEPLAHSESARDTIHDACVALEGHGLQAVSFAPEEGASCFAFAGELRLDTAPYDDSEQWMLFCPDGRVFTYHSDGSATWAPR